MSSVLCLQSVILGAAMAVSGAFILISVCRQRILPATHLPEIQIPSSHNQSLRSCLSTGAGGRRKKKKLRVRFADSVKAVGRRKSDSCGGQNSPDNRMALYRGILRDRIHVHRMACSY